VRGVVTGLARVEVYSAPGVFVERSGQELLEAPGVLALPLPAAALYDRSVALDISLRNLLRRAGYRDLDDVRQQGIERGKATHLRATIADFCGLLEIALTEERSGHLATADLRELERLYDGIKKSKRWPDGAL
jgi:hypothetical protein